MKYIKPISVFFLYFIYSLLAFLPFELAGIDVNSLTDFVFYSYLFITDVLFIVIIIFIYKESLVKEWKDFKNNGKKYIDLMVKVWIFGLALMSISNIIIGWFSPIEMPENEIIIKEVFNNIPIYIVWTTLIFAPLVEEIVFRKTLRDVIKNNFLYILLSALIFGFVHTVYNAESLYSYLYLIPYAFIGGAFAYIYTKTKNIFTTVIMHLVHNSILIGIMLLGLLR